MAGQEGRIHHVLVVCSANQCRSPMGAALLRRELRRRDPAVLVASAGVLARDGSPATAGTVQAARTFGIDLQGHRSQAATRDVIAGSDLLLGMERMHVREVVVLDPRVRADVHAEGAGAPRGGARGAAAGRVAGGVARRGAPGPQPRRALGGSPDDDVADPTSDWAVDHDSMAAEVDDLMLRLVDLLWPEGVD